MTRGILLTIAALFVVAVHANVSRATSFVPVDTTLHGVSQGAGYGTFSAGSSGINASVSVYGIIQPDYLMFEFIASASAVPALAGNAGSMTFNVATAGTYRYDKAFSSAFPPTGVLGGTSFNLKDLDTNTVLFSNWPLNGTIALAADHYLATFSFDLNYPSHTTPGGGIWATEFQPVPEPVSAAIISATLFALGSSRPRRRERQ